MKLIALLEILSIFKFNYFIKYYHKMFSVFINKKIQIYFFDRNMKKDEIMQKIKGKLYRFKK